MKAIIFILILGIVLNASTPVYDIYYNLDYNLQQNLQTETNFLFRTPTNPGDKMDFVFTFPKSYVDTFNFFLSVCQCTIWPSNEEMREMTFNDDTYCHKFTRYTDYYDDDRTIDTHIKMLRKDLGKYAKHIVTVRGMGYKFEV